MKKVILTTMLLAVFPHLYAQTQDDTSGRQFMAETPDAIVCIYNNPQKTCFVYRKTAGAKGDVVRYDGPKDTCCTILCPQAP